MLDLAKAEMEYYDHIIEISRERFKAGDLARSISIESNCYASQYESAIQTSMVNQRTARFNSSNFSTIAHRSSSSMSRDRLTSLNAGSAG